MAIVTMKKSTSDIQPIKDKFAGCAADRATLDDLSRTVASDLNLKLLAVTQGEEHLMNQRFQLGLYEDCLQVEIVRQEDGQLVIGNDFDAI